MGQTQGIYLISVAAEMLDMHPQTLRKYERAGFIDPGRAGTLRLYSADDLVRLRLIKHFVETLGLNLAGIELTLNVVNDLLAMRSTLADEPDARAATAQLDRILERRFAIRVVAPEGAPQSPTEPPIPPSTSVFDLGEGEAVEFMRPPVPSATLNR